MRAGVRAHARDGVHATLGSFSQLNEGDVFRITSYKSVISMMLPRYPTLLIGDSAFATNLHALGI